MANFDEIVQVNLSGRHVGDALMLVDEAGWNQCADDWRMMIKAGTGFGFEDANGRLVASTMVLPYGSRIGWIGMVLVTGAFQRRGLATRLIDRAISLLEKDGLIPCLDATPAGEQVYRKRGFTPVFSFHRWQRTGTGNGNAPARSLSAAEISTVQRLDQKGFGGNRGELLADVARRGAPCEVLDDGSAFALSRAGRIAYQIGPIVAHNEAAAISLFDGLQKTLQNAVFIDIPDAHADFGNRVQSAGFTSQRSLKRMIRGTGKINGFEAMFALFGPELG